MYSCVSAWMDNVGGDNSVILVNWRNLAYFAQISDGDDFVYDLTARNSIDVGEFTGMCLAELSNRWDLVY